MEESFQEFYTEWKDEQKQQLDLLVGASKADQRHSSLSALVDRVVAHYENYYRAKSRCAKTDVFLVLSPPWTTSLEDAFIWVGGWRPTTAFHLLYSKSGLQFVAKLSTLEDGGGGGGILDLGDLSSDQLHLIDELQRRTVTEERRINEKMAKQQERVADAEMVELSHDASELNRVGGDGGGGVTFDVGRIESTVNSKKEGFERILQSADDLRLGTLKAVVGILSPIQAVHFLMAAGELLLRMHDWGRYREEREATNHAVAASTTS